MSECTAQMGFVSIRISGVRPPKSFDEGLVLLGSIDSHMRAGMDSDCYPESVFENPQLFQLLEVLRRCRAVARLLAVAVQLELAPPFTPAFDAPPVFEVAQGLPPPLARGGDET